MSLYRNRAKFETLRSATAAAITGSFGALGSPLGAPAVCMTFKNATNGDVIVSSNGTDNMLFLPSNSYNVFDIRTNGPAGTDFMFPEGTQFYVKDGTSASSSGSFYMEVIVVVRE